MFTSANEVLDSKGSLSAAVVASLICLSMVSCVLLLFSGRPIMLLAIVVGAIFVLCILTNPFVGVLALFALGMVGDLQHFENFPSLSKLLIPCVALGFSARLLAAKLRARDQLVAPLVLFAATYCAGMCWRIHSVQELAGPAVFAGYAGGFFLVLNIVRTKRDIKMVFVAVCIGAALVSFAFITQWLGIETPLSLLSRSDLPMSSVLCCRRRGKDIGLSAGPQCGRVPLYFGSPCAPGLGIHRKAFVGTNHYRCCVRRHDSRTGNNSISFRLLRPHGESRRLYRFGSAKGPFLDCASARNPLGERDDFFAYG